MLILSLPFPGHPFLVTEGFFSPPHRTSLPPRTIALLQMLDTGYVFLEIPMVWLQQPEIAVH